MLNEVFGAVFSGRMLRGLPWMAVPMALPAALTMALFWLWMVTLFSLLDLRTLAPRTVSFPLLFSPLLIGVGVAAALLYLYAEVVLIDLARRIRGGEPASLVSAFTGKLRPWLNRLLASLLVMGVAAGVIAAVVLAGLRQPAVFLLFIPLLFLGAWAGLKISFYPYAIVLDGEGAVGALRKSWRLTSGYWWSLFGTFLLLGIVLGILVSMAAAAAAVPLSLAVDFSRFLPLPSEILRSPVFGMGFGFFFWYLAYTLANLALTFLFLMPMDRYARVAAYEVMKSDPRSSAAGGQASPPLQTTPPPG